MNNKILKFLTISVNYKERIFGLDLIRAIAILLVVWSHSDRVLGSHWDYLPATRWVFGHFFIFGIDGVDLFFVLSGFLIGSILLKIVEKETFFSPPVILHFWKRRWWRTLPNYYLVLIANVVLWVYVLKKQGAFSLRAIREEHIANYFIFLQNFNKPCSNFFVESWSLAIEEWFYLVLPLTLWVLMPILSKRNFSKKNIVLISLLLILGVATFLKINKVMAQGIALMPFDAGNLYRTVVQTRLDSLMFGVLGAWLKYYYSHFWTYIKWKAFVVGLILIHLLKYTAPTEHTLLSGLSLWLYPLRLSVQGIGILCFLPLADSWKQTSHTFFRWVITYISLISYSMYLINLLIIRIITDLLRPLYAPTAGNQAFEFVGYWVATIVISVLLFKYFERPTMALRK